MLTRFKVHGFKNLVEVDLSLGPFTCIAGANGVGKSNLFDAISFLGDLADKSLMDAALSVRSDGGRNTEIRSLFHRVGDRYESEIRFEVEMLVPATGVDDLGQEARATATFLRYELVLGLAPKGLVILKEALAHISKTAAKKHLPFPHRPNWRNSVVLGRHVGPFISTVIKGDQVHIQLHQDQGSDYKGGGRTRLHVAEKLPRTVLSSATNAAESPTAVLVRREMQSWRLLQLEPSALRAPDSYTAPQSMDASGAHLPASLARLCQWQGPYLVGESPPLFNRADHAEEIYTDVANRLAELVDDVHSVRVEADDSRELLKLMLKDREGTEHEARSLSDGTLRFLALAILERDPSVRGVLCLEEPENGIHPERIPAMLDLLQDLAVDPEDEVDDENPLRQVLINTHSPAVVAQVKESDLVVVFPEIVSRNGHQGRQPGFRWLKDTWREKHRSEIPAVAEGSVVSYLYPVRPMVSPEVQDSTRRVVDRPGVQQWLSRPRFCRH